ncbi:MAG TPA: lytic transglycosylase domain-containing protein [Kiloniellales bacterium]|nr:lytic transglycosylase domain-containing protein [Kiloniellales bacterium]
MRRHLAVLLLLVFATLPSLPAAAKAISGADVGILGQALALIDQGKAADARALAKQAKEPLVYDLVVFFDISRKDALPSFVDVAGHLAAHPNWPRRVSLELKAEAFFPGGLAPEDVAAWFAEHPAQTGLGALLEVDALMALGRSEQAKTKAVALWRSFPLTNAQEKDFRTRYGAWLSHDDHVARVSALLDQEQSKAAAEVATLAGGGYPALAAARTALQDGKKNAVDLVDALPKEVRYDPGLIVDLANYLQRKEKTGKLDALLIDLGPDNAGRPETLWRLRFAASQRLQRQGSYAEAYQIARDHGLASGLGFAELEWLAGYIALENLRDAATGYRHFERYFNGSDTPISKGKAAYWAGIAADKLGKTAVALDWFTKGSQYDSSFYGQLSDAKLGEVPGASLPPMPGLDESLYQGFANGELARIVRALAGTGDRKRTAVFFDFLLDQGQDQAHFLTAGRLATELGRWDLVVQTGKDARRKGIVLIDYLFPVPPIAVAEPELALVLALIRQESEFDQEAISSADARGLMQLLPGTAKGVAKKLGLPYELGRLTNDPDYNVELGSAYLAGLIDDFGGSYILSMAGYNAGPHRATAWIDQNGDPRSPGTDTVAWIEAIPFAETRNYVMRVSEGLVVYRQLLGQVQPTLWEGYNPATDGPHGMRLSLCCN